MLQRVFSLCCIFFLFAALCSYGAEGTGKQDLNKEFVEQFFGQQESKPEVKIKIHGKVDSLKNQEGFTKKSGDAADPSWVGRFLQIAIVVLLLAIVLLMSQRSRKRGRF